jgi:tripartite-type tricarboxylate transporter receptor subunit TctC
MTYRKINMLCNPNKEPTMRFLYSVIFVSMLASLTSANTAIAQNEDIAGFYAKNSVRIIVGFSPGGGYDQYARLASRHLGKHVPGSPSVIVQNQPGAASRKALQYLDNGAPNDGTTMATFNSGLITGSLTSPRSTQFNFNEFAWVGNIAEDIRVCFTWGARGISTWDAFLRREKLVFGNTGVGTSAYIDDRILQILFGVNLQTVQGYPGSADKKIAIETGELDGDCGSWTSLPDDWVRNNKINLHVRFSKTLPTNMPVDVPYAGDLLEGESLEVFRLLIAGAEIGRPFLMSKRTAPDKLRVMRDAFDNAMKDPALLAEAEKMRLIVKPDRGEDVEKMIARIYRTPPGVVAKAKEISGE